MNLMVQGCVNCREILHCLFSFEGVWKDPTGNLPGLLLYNKRSENSEREVETNSKGNDGNLL